MIPSRMLRYLDEIVRLGSIRQAAEKTNVAASAINRQLLDLEAELGTPLFHRLPRGLRLTAAGEIVIDYVRETLKGYERTRERLHDLQGLKAGRVVVAAREGLAQGLVAETALHFKETYPHIKLTILGIPTDEVIARVDAGDADFGLMYQPLLAHTLEVVGSYEVVFGAVVSPDHPLAARRSVTLAECAAFPAVLSEKWPSAKFLLAAAAQARVKIEASIETDSIAAMKTLVLDGRHIAFLSNMETCFGSDRIQIRHLPISRPRVAMQSLEIVRRRDATASQAAGLFIAALQAAIPKKALRRAKS